DIQKRLEPSPARTLTGSLAIAGIFGVTDRRARARTSWPGFGQSLFAPGPAQQATTPTVSDEPRLGVTRIRVAVEALAARDSKAALLDEALVEIAGGLERLGVRGAFADELRDVVHDAETHAIHHPARAHAAPHRDHPGSIDALVVAHAPHQQVQRGGAPGHEQAV